MKVSHMIGFLVLFLLAVLGIGSTMYEKPLFVIITVLLLGLIVYWIKYPPAFLTKAKKGSERSKYAAAAKQTKSKKDRPRSKTAPFKVIEGGRDDNDTPRYH